MIEDERDQISPMDALVVAAAASDKECVALYTTDRQLISDISVSEIVDEWRNERNYPLFKIKHVSNIIKISR